MRRNNLFFLKKYPDNKGLDFHANIRQVIKALQSRFQSIWKALLNFFSESCADKELKQSLIGAAFREVVFRNLSLKGSKLPGLFMDSIYTGGGGSNMIMGDYGGKDCMEIVTDLLCIIFIQIRALIYGFYRMGFL